VIIQKLHSTKTFLFDYNLEEDIRFDIFLPM